jgi:hypothetical protein
MAIRRSLWSTVCALVGAASLSAGGCGGSVGGEPGGAVHPASLTAPAPPLTVVDDLATSTGCLIQSDFGGNFEVVVIQALLAR